MTQEEYAKMLAAAKVPCSSQATPCLVRKVLSIKY